MTHLIIYNQDNSTVAVIIPTKEAIDQHGIQAIAIKDVPAGKSFKIIEASEVPTDRTYREAWRIDDALLTDGVGGESNEFPEESPNLNIEE